MVRVMATKLSRSGTVRAQSLTVLIDHSMEQPTSLE
jgi:hypothetical protein